MQQIILPELEQLKKQTDFIINNKDILENKDIEKQSINATNQNTQTNSNLGNQIIGE